MSDTSRAIKNLKAIAAVLVVSFHSSLAYVSSQPAVSEAFNQPPYRWLATAVLDPHRWLGFDIYAAFLYVGLMPLMFFMSGIFVWGSLVRKGTKRYLVGRILRIGLPFALGVYLFMPFGYYPAYALRTPDASWLGYWHAFLKLPFWPSGPLWFLWELLAFDLAASLLYIVAPGFVRPLQRLGAAGERPARYFIIMIAVSALAYVPLALAFGASHWTEFGPFALQADRVLLYAVYFFAGVGIGVHGYERGLMAAGGALARGWRIWTLAAVLTFFAWMGSMAPSFYGYGSTLLDIVSALALTVAVAAGCFGFLAVFLRFCTRDVVALNSLAQHAYAIYLIHYPFVVWLQFALFGSALPAAAKAALVFSGALFVSWAIAAGFGRCTALLRNVRPRDARFTTPTPLEKSRLGTS